MANDVKRGIPNGTYDVAVDKGTLDGMFTSDEGDKLVRKALHEIDRILKPDGVYIIISYNNPVCSQC
jgi:EEF1A lysine methyltransferase 4